MPACKNGLPHPIIIAGRVRPALYLFVLLKIQLHEYHQYQYNYAQLPITIDGGNVFSVVNHNTTYTCGKVSIYELVQYGNRVDSHYGSVLNN